LALAEEAANHPWLLFNRNVLAMIYYWLKLLGCSSVQFKPSEVHVLFKHTVIGGEFGNWKSKK